VIRIPTELAWAAGFFEGEGWVTWNTTGTLRIACSQSYGMYELERFLSAVGYGRIYGPYNTAKGRVRHDWGANAEEAVAVIEMLRPYLTPGAPKLIKFDEGWTP
jgi:hypothetical protein